MLLWLTKFFFFLGGFTLKVEIDTLYGGVDEVGEKADEG